MSTKTQKKKKPASLDIKKARSGWWFVLPFAIGFLLLYLPMIVDSIWFSFNEIEIQRNGGYELIFVGFKNYSDALFSDANFVQILVSSLQRLILEIPAIVIFSLFMAVLLNQKMFGRAVFRAILFIPVILSTGIIDSIDQGNAMLTHMNSGSIDTGAAELEGSGGIIDAMDVTKFLGSMEIGASLVDYVVNIVNNIFNIVNRSGVQMLIFLSGLQSISPAIYESCKMEGATPWETFWKITFPMISPMILVNALYTVIDSFTSQSNEVMRYINNVYSSPGGGNVLSAAMSWMYFLIVLVLIAVVALALSRFVFYQRRD